MGLGPSRRYRQLAGGPPVRAVRRRRGGDPPGMAPREAARSVFRDAGKHRSVNAGWPEAAFAGALGLRLAEPRVYGGETVTDAWMGSGREAATVADISRSLALFVMACAVMAVSIAVLWALQP